jgi:hypothetical protein
MPLASVTSERRASRADRRRLGRGGRRAEDRGVAELRRMTSCMACGTWAALSALAYQPTRSTATYLCPRCGEFDTAVTFT